MTKTTAISETKRNPLIRKVSKLVELEKQLKIYKEQVAEIKEELLDTMQKNDVLTLKTGEYTISRAKRVTPQVEDYEKLKKSLDKEDIPYEVVEAFAPHMTETFKQIVKMGKQLDGLEAKETEYVSVRIAKGGETK